jgi:glycerophosphoryl diester phosphodiesterase
MNRRDCECIGHAGASALAPGNTIASFEAALDHGVDLVEFDVRRWRGELVLAHTVLDAWTGAAMRLHDALAHLSSRRFREIGLNVDVKHTGCEAELLGGLRGAGLLDRALVSSQVPAVLDRARRIEPRVKTGISIGGPLARLSRLWWDWRTQVLAGLAARRWDALMAQHRLIDPVLLDDVVSRGARLYAWTVNERATIDSLRGLGVHGITTADPRLFAAA